MDLQNWSRLVIHSVYMLQFNPISSMCMLILMWLSACRSDSCLVVSKSTLIICPASLVHHWKREIDRHVKAARLTVYLYHGPNREKSAKV